MYLSCLVSWTGPPSVAVSLFCLDAREESYSFPLEVSRGMARFYPNAQSASVPPSERRVFEALRKLSDDWVVAHGVRFVAAARGKRPPRNGEANFVLVHPRQGL